MMKQFDHMIERKLNPRLKQPRTEARSGKSLGTRLRLKFLAGCGQFSDFSNNLNFGLLWALYCIKMWL
jgi:hypothetical protein